MKIDWDEILRIAYLTSIALVVLSFAVASGFLPTLAKFLEPVLTSPKWKIWKPRFRFVIVSIISFPLWVTVALFLFIPSYIFFNSPSNPITDWLFAYQLPEYERVVTDIKSGKIQTGQNVVQIDIVDNLRLPGRAKRINAAHCDHGTVTVAFLVGGSALGGHWGYLFDDCDIPAISMIHDNPWLKGYRISPIQGNWYQFEQ